MGIPLPYESNGDVEENKLGHFEGFEKRLEVEFYPCLSTCEVGQGLRDLTREQLDEMLNAAQCTIVAQLNNDHFDSYVLSESSLFVYPNYMVIKTCGTTTPLNAIPLLLCYASGLGLKVRRCKYTRGAYLFPEDQPFPHAQFPDEADFLDKYFGHLERKACVLSDSARKHNWHIYSAAVRGGGGAVYPDNTPLHTVEICMTELDRICASKFYKSTCKTAAEMTRASSISDILPGSDICDFAFDPCGYSMNSIEGPALSTIHITPEDGYSYASFEAMGYDPHKLDLEYLVERVLKCFKPAMFTVSVHLMGMAGSWGSPIYPAGYICESTQTETLPGGCAVVYHTFKLPPASVIKVPKGMSLCSMENIGSTAEEIDSFVKQKVIESGVEEPFYVMDLAVLAKLWRTWKAALPRVHPFYAVKCNPDKTLLSALAAFGAGFDVASKAELHTVMNLGVLGDRILFANPCKLPSHITEAAECGVNLTTFDSASELYKLKKASPQAEAVIRIKASDPNARCPLGTKYGAEENEWKLLLEIARDISVQVVGVAFHVGSGASDQSAFVEGVRQARVVYDIALSLGMHPFRLLDVGGGFVSDGGNGVNFSKAAGAINAALDHYFPSSLGITVIAEPGRFFAEEPFTLAAQIFGTRMRKKEGTDFAEYWINDGVYGSMNCLLYDHAILSARYLRIYTTEEENRDLYSSTVFGPTCDGLDTVLKNVNLPLLDCGDWLLFPRMGAYTKAAGSNFNGFDTGKIPTTYVNSGNLIIDH